MNQAPKIIAFIPARGGSKSIPLKNIKEFCGKALIAWCLEALDLSRVDEIIVSSDSDEINNCVAGLNNERLRSFDRDPASATDEASTESAMLDFLNRSEYAAEDIFILVQATSPWTEASHIDQALHVYENEGLDSLLSVVENHSFLWDHKGNSINYDHTNRQRRQDMQKQYQENGAFYINRVGNILRDKNRLSGNIGYYIMPKYSALELDDLEDWDLAESIMHRMIDPTS